MSTTAVGMVLGLILLLAVTAAGLRDRHVPAWAVVVGPLVMVVALRRTFLGLHPGMSGPEIGALVRTTVPMGGTLVTVGLAAMVVGVVTRAVGRGAPALAQVGALLVAFGLVWGPFADGQAALWRLADAPWSELLEERRVRAERLARRVDLATLVVVLGWGPAAVWGFLRDRWEGVGEAVAAVVLVVLTLSTGQPSRRAVQGTVAPWSSACPPAEGVAWSGSGTHPAVGRTVLRGTAGALERWDGDAWVPAVAVRGPVAWAGPPERAARALNALGVEAEAVVVLGRAPSPGPEGLFSDHPALAAAACRGAPLQAVSTRVE